MKTLILISASLIILLSCTTKSNNISTPTNEKRKTNNEKYQTNNDSENPYYSRNDTSKLNVSNTEWKKILPDSVYQIARNKNTEYPFTGKYWNYTGLGNYFCVVCGNKLFVSDAKFASSCGWPSFYETVRKNAVKYINDTSHGMVRTEVICGRCDSHLGHIFDDGPKPTGKRFCMNSLMLDFVPND